MAGLKCHAGRLVGFDLSSGNFIPRNLCDFNGEQGTGSGKPLFDAKSLKLK